MQASKEIRNFNCSKIDLKIINEIKIYLEENIHEDIHIVSLVRQFGINEFKLKTIFKQVYGITVMRYLRKCRMDRAQDMLVNTDLEIKEIAFLIGFKYAHHFSKVYQAHFHVLPKEVRGHIYDNLLINKS